MGLLDGKVVIITGSGRGIGKGVAQRFIEEGAKVTVNDIDADVCNATAAELGADNAVAAVADVTNVEQVQAMFDKTVEKFGKVDVLINCAGTSRDAMIHKMGDDLLRFIIDVNLKGTHVCTQTALKLWADKDPDEFKKIVNFASTTGVTGNVGQANYAIAKGGIITYTKSIAREYADDRITCNTVAPGFIETRMTAPKGPGDKLGMPEAIRNAAISGIPFARKDADGIPRGGLPLHVANVLLFYSSELGDWITGQLTTIDGGMMI